MACINHRTSFCHNASHWHLRMHHATSIFRACRLRPLQQPCTAVSQPLYQLAASSSEPWSVWAALVACGALGMHAERTTRMGATLTGPVCSMLLACIANQLGLLPDGTSATLPSLQLLLAKLATPLLLLGADLRSSLSGARALLPAFCLSASSTIAASLIASLLLAGPLTALGAVHQSPESGLHLAAALTAKNIGGSINYVAVASAMGVPQQLFTAGIAADNLAALVYFPLVSALASRPWCSEAGVAPGPGPAAATAATIGAATPAATTEQQQEQVPVATPSVDAQPPPPPGPTPAAPAPTPAPLALASDELLPEAERSQHGVSDGQVPTTLTSQTPAPQSPQEPQGDQSSLMAALAVALCVVAVCERFGRAALPASTALTIGLATAFPAVVRGLAPQGAKLAGVALFTFFASAGAAAGSMRALVAAENLPVLLFLLLLYGVHLCLLLLLGGRLLGLRGSELLVASHACIGSAATVASLVRTKSWERLLVPGILAANMGNAVATLIGASLARLLPAVCSAA